MAHIEYDPEREAIRKAHEAQLEQLKNHLAEKKAKQPLNHREVRIDIEAAALPTKMFFIMNALSAVIAGFGMLINSPAVVIGAMLVAMMLGPITGVALAIIDYRLPLLKKSLLTLLGGTILVIFIGMLIGWFHSNQPLTSELLARTQPTSMDLVIALAGGAAGAYAAISPHLSVAVVGVAVATALVPPLVACGILFATGDYHLSFNAFLLASTNIIAIEFMNSLVLWFAGFRRKVDDKPFSLSFDFLKRNTISLLLLLVIGLYLSYNLANISEEQSYQRMVNAITQDYFLEYGDVLIDTSFTNESDHQAIRVVLRGEFEPTSSQVRELNELIQQKALKKYPQDLPIRLQIRYIPTKIIELDSVDKISPAEATELTIETKP